MVLYGLYNLFPHDLYCAVLGKYQMVEAGVGTRKPSIVETLNHDDNFKFRKPLERTSVASRGELEKHFFMGFVQAVDDHPEPLYNLIIFAAAFVARCFFELFHVQVLDPADEFLYFRAVEQLSNRGLL